jgi:hypothetical protein
VQYWTLSTMSSGKFNPLRLTERQQVAYVSAKTGPTIVDEFEASPFRLDKLSVTLRPTVSAESQVSSVEDEPKLLADRVQPSTDVSGSELSIFSEHLYDILPSDISTFLKHCDDLRMKKNTVFQQEKRLRSL